MIFSKRNFTHDTLNSTDADFAGFFSLVSSANVDTLSVNAVNIPPCRVSFQGNQILNSKIFFHLNLPFRFKCRSSISSSH